MPRVVSSRTGTKDMQMVDISLRVLSRPDVDKLPTIYKELGEDYNDRVLPSITNEVLKAVVVSSGMRLVTSCGTVAMTHRLTD